MHYKYLNGMNLLEVTLYFPKRNAQCLTISILKIKKKITKIGKGGKLCEVTQSGSDQIMKIVEESGFMDNHSDILFILEVKLESRCDKMSDSFFVSSGSPSQRSETHQGLCSLFICLFLALLLWKH